MKFEKITRLTEIQQLNIDDETERKALINNAAREYRYKLIKFV